MSSPTIQDLVEKIEAENAKAVPNEKNIEFWERQIDKLRSANTTPAGNIHLRWHFTLFLLIYQWFEYLPSPLALSLFIHLN